MPDNLQLLFDAINKDISQMIKVLIPDPEVADSDNLLMSLMLLHSHSLNLPKRYKLFKID